MNKNSSSKQRNNWNTFSVSFQSASPRWEPQISILCEAGQQYLPQYLSEDGRWSSELNVKVPGVSCLRDKMDLLDYCKKVSFSLKYLNQLNQQQKPLNTDSTVKQEIIET